MKPKKECSTCNFGNRFHDDVICRRYPPTSDGNGPRRADHQPVLKTYDWCGEYKHGKPPKVEEKKDYSRTAAVLLALFAGILGTLWLVAGVAASN